MSREASLVAAINSSLSVRIGGTSPERIRPIHECIHSELEFELARVGSSLRVRSMKANNEAVVRGALYAKKVDIALLRDSSDRDLEAENNVVAAVSVKAPLSNFKQNSNNYFEQLIGETVNLRERNIAHGHIMILPVVVPYFKSDGTLSRVETIGSVQLSKYLRMNEHRHRGFASNPLCIFLVEFETIPRNKAGMVGARVHHQSEKAIPGLTTDAAAALHELNNFDLFVERVVLEATR